MLPPGILMMFALTACPAGWAEQTPVAGSCGPGCTVMAQSYASIAPQPYIWCVKQKDATAEPDHG